MTQEREEWLQLPVTKEFFTLVANRINALNDTRYYYHNNPQQTLTVNAEVAGGVAELGLLLSDPFGGAEDE